MRKRNKCEADMRIYGFLEQTSTQSQSHIKYIRFLFLVVAKRREQKMKSDIMCEVEHTIMNNAIVIVIVRNRLMC